MVTTIVTEGGLEAWTAAARRAQATTDDMVYLTTFNVQITGSQHSDIFLSGRIVEDVTLLAAFRERGFSNIQGRPSQSHYSFATSGTLALCVMLIPVETCSESEIFHSSFELAHQKWLSVQLLT